MKARDRVKLCIEQARNHSGETALRAVINAVEILADQLKDEPGDRTHDSAPNATPAPNLIERLKKAYVFAEMEAIAGGGDPVDMGVRAIFAELAKMPVELPSDDFDDLIDYEQSAWSECANAVLRAFGQPSQTTQDVADALRRVRKSFAGYQGECAAVVREAIGAELAKLEAKPASNAATPKFFANENALRGSYFCTEFPFRPFLHIGRDIEFDDIPRILKLGRNDVVEVRVVERAKQ